MGLSRSEWKARQQTVTRGEALAALTGKTEAELLDERQQSPRPPGHPPNAKLTPAVHKAIVTAVRAGNYRKVAAKYAGIGSHTFYTWCYKGRRQQSGPYYELVKDIERAEAESEMRAVVTVQDNIQQGDWKAAMTYLERTHPDRWGRRERIEHSGPGGSPIDVQSRVLLELSRLADSPGADVIDVAAVESIVESECRTPAIEDKSRVAD